MTTPDLTLEWVGAQRFAVCRLPVDADVPDWEIDARDFISVTRTGTEVSIVAPEAVVPDDVTAERGWVALRVVGTLEFSMVGVLAKLTGALADAGVSVFVMSTYDTDYVLVKEADRARVEQALESWGWHGQARLAEGE